MIEMLRRDNFVQVCLITLPSPLPLRESAEFVQQLHDIEPLPVKVVCNYSLAGFSELKLPSELNAKVQNENQAIENADFEISEIIPFCLAKEPKSLTKELLPSMQNLV